MLFEVVSPINFGGELLPVRSPLNAVLTHRSMQKVVVPLPDPQFVRLIANAVGRFSEESDLAKAVSPKVQSLDFSRGGMS
ncbi:MAG: hypothetical protein ACREPH_02960 [Rhodanobacteraceae bacterium]